MKVIDVSIFNSFYERKLLWLKLQLEADYVDQFVICQNLHNYRGERRGECELLTNILERRPEFAKFKNKITVITVEKDFTYGNMALANTRDPREYHLSEVFLRESPTQYILNTFKDEDRLIISDIDEVVSFDTPKRRDKIFGAFKEDGPIQFERARFQYDYDIYARREHMDMITPSSTVGNIRRCQARLSDKKWVGRHVPNGDNIAIFEFCSCMDYEGLQYKYLNSSIHTLLTQEELDIALLTGTWEMRGCKPNPNCRWHWFDRVELTEENSPTYVRENLDSLKTNLVPDNYKENRLKYFGVSPEFTNDSER